MTKRKIMHRGIDVFDYDDPLLTIGKRCFIKRGTMMCGEGFSFTRNEDMTLTFNEHHFGVVIGNDVHVGSLCVIDRGHTRDTVIGSGTKIDNHVHISHNCVIGENCIIGQGSTILGNVTIGNNSEIWSHAIIHQNITIGNNCAVGANTYLRKDLPDNHVAYMGVNGLVIKPIDQTKKYKNRGYISLDSKEEDNGS